jgi:glycosyltransferase involved in cell wall biosynthesis
MTKLSIVVPVFNEVEAIKAVVVRLQEVFRPHPEISLEIVFVNDGSTDDSLEAMLQQKPQGMKVRVIDLSRNFGKEAALTAGLQHASGDAVVPMDVDLQDPPEVILEMIAKWREGYEVVLARRTDRSADSWAKRTSAAAFYRLHNKIASPMIPENVGDFRLMDRRVVEALKQLPESQRFMKGLFAWVGFRTAVVDYTRAKRAAGTSKFNGWKLWTFAIEGVTSFSNFPLRIWTYLGVAVSLSSFIIAFVAIIRVFLLGRDVPGYASLFVAVNFLGGVQLIGIGVLGEYLGRSYFESKRRPVYLIRHIYED